MTKMFKQEEYSLNTDYSPPTNGNVDENFMTIGPALINLDDIENIMLPQGIDGSFVMLSPQFEDTMDVAQKFEQQQQEFFPVSQPGPPERKVFAGDLNFQVEINAKDINKNKYQYSYKLNRIYVDMKCSFPVTFSWLSGHPHAPRPAFVRACVVFSDESQMEKRVERCTQHKHEAANDNISKEMVLNVLHSCRARGTRGVYYCGRADQPDSWLSTVVEIPGAGGGSHAYQMVCKNSCSSGINRRPIEIIFTLEDVNGTVYGRQCVGVRSCSCPRRDLNRDESTEAPVAGKRRVATAGPTGNGTKKVKLEVASDAVITLPSLPGGPAGVRAAVAGLQVMAAMLEQANAAPAQPSPVNTAAVRNIHSKIEELKRHRTT